MTNEHFEYLKPKDIPAHYPIPIGTFRMWLLARNKNGLDKCVRKIGRTVLIRRDLFDKWLESFKE